MKYEAQCGSFCYLRLLKSLKEASASAFIEMQISMFAFKLPCVAKKCKGEKVLRRMDAKKNQKRTEGSRGSICSG